MIMCVLLCYPVSIRIYYQQGGLFLVSIKTWWLAVVINVNIFSTYLEKNPQKTDDRGVANQIHKYLHGIDLNLF